MPYQGNETKTDSNKRLRLRHHKPLSGCSNHLFAEDNLHADLGGPVGEVLRRF